MPKIKTNKTASKKFKTTASGKIKRAKAYKSHNTAKKSPKRKRNLRGLTYVDQSNESLVKGLLPYLNV
ncbi:UNVERIFIED_CONTAM: hypothetical protein GTU68_048462 [Idotea baltica]|nr:hypothetical protein [Idotea baltica]